MTQETKELYKVIKQSQQQVMAEMGGNLPARVVRVNATTIDVQPVINKKINGQSVRFPVFKEVPPLFLYGGGSYETWPISVGDYALCIVAESCFDSWYDGRDQSDPLEDRRFDYSDMFAIVGPKNRAGGLAIPSRITRSGDSVHTGNHEHNGDTTQTGNKTQTGDIDQTGNKTQVGNFGLTGVFTVTNSGGGGRSQLGGEYDLVGDIFIDGVSLRDFINNHTHGGVSSGTEDTGTPII